VCLFAFGWLILCTGARRLVAQSCPADLPIRLSAIARDSRGAIGMAVRHIERDELVELNGSQQLPMQSVFKLPIAMYILNEADHDRVDLGQSITLTSRDLAPGRSPMASTVMQYGRHSFTVRELLGLMIEQSDNTAGDVLLHNFGDPETFRSFSKITGLWVSM
jgi:beta-lactamase class A